MPQEPDSVRGPARQLPPAWAALGQATPLESVMMLISQECHRAISHLTAMNHSGCEIHGVLQK